MKSFKIYLKKIYNYLISDVSIYLKKNVLFYSFVLLSMITGICLRWVTVGGAYSFTFKPILCDLVFSMFIGSFAYLIKPTHRFRYYFIWLFFAVALSIANTIYYQFFSSFLSVNLISTASMIGEVNDSLFDKMHLYQFFYIIFLIIYIIIYKYLKKINYLEHINRSKRYFSYTLSVAGVITCLLFITLSKTEMSRFVKQWNREYIVQRFGLYVYTANDLVQSVQPKLDTLFGYEEAKSEFIEYYSCKWDGYTKKSNEYTDIFKGKNVIFVHMESIQNFLVGLTINGEEVTPNINKLISEGLYFSKFYPQISVGTSSDTEFTLLTGLMPSSSGTVFVNYYDREYASMPKYFNELGYYTFSMHANSAPYWNRQLMHQNLGYQKFYAKDSYVVPDESDADYVGLGLSDKSFLKQVIPILNDIKTNNQPFFGTIITLSNHSPFNDIEKYDYFNVKMKYSYIDDDGNYIEAEADYLDGTSMGNYLTSAHYADAALGQFFEDIKSNGLDENTVFILYGDHESRLSKKQFNLLYNYDPLTDSIKDESDETYYSLENYNYDLLKNTPLIIWTSDSILQGQINDVMGMYDVLPTVANMFGFEAKYALGSDVFSDSERIVVFPNGNVLTNKVYYNATNDDYIAFTNEVIESDYIDNLKAYADKILSVSNGIITHDLIKNESQNIGVCQIEK